MLNIFELFSTTEQPIIDKINKGIENTNKFFDNISKVIKAFPIDGFLEVICSFTLVDNFYPPCLYLNKDQQLEILELLNNQDINSVDKMLFDLYDEKFLHKICDKWYKSVNPNRTPLLKEAISCYVEGKYYACNSLLISQYGGIINENNIVLTKNDQCDFSERLKQLEQELQSGKCATAEKNIVQRHFLINLQGSLYAFERYFLNYIYSSGEISEQIKLNVANRNKVLHGVDCDFGTKIKALKTIICIDMLINLPETQTKIWEDKHNG